jgi:glycosyltransferase involved in cell wall biosynthesis
MKIFYLAHSRLPSDSANSIQVMHMCRALARDHEVILFARGLASHEGHQKNIFEHYRLPAVFEIRLPSPGRFPGLDSFAGYIRLIKNLNGQQPELCFGRHLKSLTLAAKMGLPVLYEAHEVPRSRMEKILISQICKARNFMGMVFISNALKERYMSIFPGLTMNRTVTAHDGISVDYVDQISPLDTPLPGRPGAFKAGYAGGLRPEKGVPLILDTAGMLPGTDFHLVGGSREEILFWQSRAKDMPNVFFHGHVEPWKAVSFQKAFDLLLAPYQQLSWTRKDGRLEVVRDQERFIGNSPLKYFEYMACQKPILTSDLPIAREVFTHGQDAVLLGENPADWAQWITRLERDMDMARKFGHKAGKRVLDFTWDKRAAIILSGLPELLRLQKQTAVED